MAAQLMDADVAARIGAELGERTPERLTHRNGYRPRAWDTRVGQIELAIPKLRQGSYFPSFLEPRRRAEQALVAVVQEAYVNGVSTRKVDRLVEQLGLHHMRRTRSAGCAPGWTSRSPCSASDPGRCLPVPVAGRQGRAGPRAGRGAPQALVLAYGVQESGRREVIGLDVGEAETEAFWRGFLQSLRARGLDGVQLVVSDAHTGLATAIAKVFGCPWQRCTVHFLRDMLGHVSRAQQPLVSGAIRQIFVAASATEAHDRLGQVADQLRPHAPKVAQLLEDAEADLLAFYGFPAEHWSKLRSTNPLERVNREIGRRTDVVGIFPNDAALLRLAGMLLLEQNDEWLVGRRYLSESSMALVLAAGADHHPDNPDHQEVPQLTAP
jgi:putative transposase